MDKDKLGNKHLCSNCGTKFFDFKKEVPICPKCGSEVIIKTKPRLGRPPLNKNIVKNAPEVNNETKEKVVETQPLNEDDIEISEDIENLVSLDDLENEEEDISNTDDNIDIITEENNEENLSEITDIDISDNKEEN